MQAPFPCGQSWRGDSDNSSAHAGTHEIDFNRGASATADLGDTIVAAARGRVVTAAHQGSANGYGNLVKIDHGNGWYTYYAHLRSISVRAGTTVKQGQKIGELGNTSKPGNAISPHLHFELRNDGSYPGSVEPVRFDGTQFAYPEQSITSRNCNDPEQLCGPGFRAIDWAYLRGSAGVHQGTVYLAWNASTSNNCVVTVKHRNRSASSATSAYLEPAGSKRSTDSGSFTSYAGPVTRSSPGCIRWGGAISGVTYNSPSEHC
ncbi:M23 family metallopeptidase [Kineococcus vitellinus]|uniref:M23 family metallopeptidase n=1 Tax=Kineococcus vitellinus TaxID=2696565 RepID=UPI00196B3084|nr:M23 family metallopeptidase [Kineococcus vitellinus]